MRPACASRAFSTSSLTTLAGRSTTSPAAIWLATCSGSRRMRFMRVSYENASNLKPARRKSKGNLPDLYSKNEIRGHARPHPCPLPQERGKHAQVREFSRPLAWHCFIGLTGYSRIGTNVPSRLRRRLVLAFGLHREAEIKDGAAARF